MHEFKELLSAFKTQIKSRELLKSLRSNANPANSESLIVMEN